MAPNNSISRHIWEATQTARREPSPFSLDDTATLTRPTDDSELFESVMLNDTNDNDWEDWEVRKIQRQEDAQFVLDCPEDETYETNRQRYLASPKPLPTNKRERAMQVLQAAPEVLRNTPHYLSAGAEVLGQAANSAYATVHAQYEDEGAASVARSVATHGWTLTRDLTSMAVVGAVAKVEEWWYKPPEQDQKLQRRSSTGQNYTLPSLKQIREGLLGQKPQNELRDLAIDDDGPLGGEEWELDDDLEDTSSNARARKLFSQSIELPSRPARPPGARRQSSRL